MICNGFLYFRSKFLEHHAEILPTSVIFLNIVMAKLRSVLVTSMSWMACPAKIMLHTATRADARHMIPSANISLPQVHLITVDAQRFLQLIKLQELLRSCTFSHHF